MSVVGSVLSSVGGPTLSWLLKLDITMDIFHHIVLKFRANIWKNNVKFLKIKSKIWKSSCISVLKKNCSTDNFEEVSLTYYDSYLLYYSYSQFCTKFFIFVLRSNYGFLNPLCYNKRRLLNLDKLLNTINIAWSFDTLLTASRISCPKKIPSPLWKKLLCKTYAQGLFI